MNQATIVTEAFSKAARDVAEFGRANLEALAQSAQAYVQGTQELGRQAFAVTQELNAQGIEGAKALVGAKSLKDAAEVQAQFARTALDRTANESVRLQQAAIQVIERAFAPLVQRTAALSQTAHSVAA